MNLAIDIGNSNIKFAFFRKAFIYKIFTIKTENMKKNKIDIKDREELIKSIKKIEKAAISSVVPEITDYVVGFVNNYMNIKIYKLNELNYNIKIDYDGLLGEDRMMAIYGAFKEYGEKSLVIDIGSALTFSVLDKNTVFKGGLISLGPFNILNSLTKNTSQLEKNEFDLPVKNIGNDTASAVDAGIYWMIIGAIEKGVEKIQEELGYKLKKIITGGGLKYFKDYFEKNNYKLDSYLVLKGINYLLMDNEINVN